VEVIKPSGSGIMRGDRWSWAPRSLRMMSVPLIGPTMASNGYGDLRSIIFADVKARVYLLEAE